jgi:hypothetical protein
MRTRLTSLLIALAMVVPVSGLPVSSGFASVSPSPGPSPIATSSHIHPLIGGGTDVAVGRDRTVYITIGEGTTATRLHRLSLEYTVTHKASTGTTATLTIGSHLLKTGDVVDVDITDPDFDGTQTITGTTSTTISYASSAPSLASTAAVGSVRPDPISGAPEHITPTGLPAGVALSEVRGIAVSHDKNSIAAGYMNAAGIAVYPWDAAGPTTPTRILLGPAGTSARFGFRNLAWDQAGNIYALMHPKAGDPAQIWVFSPSATIDSAPDRIIMLDAGTVDEPTAWSGWSWAWITSGMAIDVTGQVSLAGATSAGWIIAYVDPGITGPTKPSGYLQAGVREVWGITADDSGRTIITYIESDRGLRAWAPGARSTAANPAVEPEIDVSSAGSGPTRGPIAFDPFNRSIVLANGDNYGLLQRYATGSSATATTLALPYLGAPSSSPPASSPPSSSPPSSSDPDPAPPTDSATPSGSGSQASGATSPVPGEQQSSTPSPEQSSPSLPSGDTENVSLAGMVGARLFARGAQGKTCVGSQCVSGRRWVLQMCLPAEAKITVQRRIAKRWVNQKPRTSNLAPLACPEPTRSVSIVGPRRAKAGAFRILLRIENAPRIVSGLRVT